MIGGMSAGIKGDSGRPASNPPLSPEGAGLVVHIGFSTTGHWLSRWIRRFTRSRVSHCIVVYRSEIFGQEMVLEASGNGYRIISWRRWDRANRLIALYRLDLPEQQLRDGLAELASHLGDAYDTMSLVGFALRGWFGLKKIPFDSRRKLVCSEAVALFLTRCGVAIESIGCATPQTLFELAERTKETFALVEQSPTFTRLLERLARQQGRRTSRPMAAPLDPPLVG